MPGTKNPLKANTISGSPVPLPVFSLYLAILHSSSFRAYQTFFFPSASVVSISTAALIAGSLLKICILILSSPLPGLLFLEASMHGFPLPLWGHLLKAKSTCVGLGFKNQKNNKQSKHGFFSQPSLTIFATDFLPNTFAGLSVAFLW